MLSKKFRLNRKQIYAINRKGRGESFGFLGIKYLPNNLDFARFAVVVPKALVKKATERNRLRRVIFNALTGSKMSGKDYIIRLFKNPEEDILRGQINKIFH